MGRERGKGLDAPVRMENVRVALFGWWPWLIIIYVCKEKVLGRKLKRFVGWEVKSQGYW